MSFCKNCGTQISEGGKFCPKCGTPAAAPAPTPAAPSPLRPATGFSKAGGLGGPGGSVPAPAPAKPAAPVAPAPAPEKPAAPVAPAPAPVKPAAPVTPPPAPIKEEQIDELPPEELFPPSKPAAPRPSSAGRRISAGRELRLLLRQGLLVMFGETRNLVISLLFPVIAALITVFVAGENMFVSTEATRSGCFVLVCAAIWGGLFNSISTLVKERENIRRDYISGALRIGCYISSRAIIQVVLCAVQSLILCLSIPMITMVHSEPKMPEAGVLGGPAMIEFYLTLFLVMYASDALGLLISSFVKKEALASSLAPYILIAQLLFSGVLFALEGFANGISVIMISRWGMEAMGSICNLNETPTAIYMSNEGNPALEWLKYPEEKAAYEASPEHLTTVFAIMVAFIAVQLIASALLLRRVKNDRRG